MQQFNEPFRARTPEGKAKQAADREAVRAAGNPMHNYPKPPAAPRQVSYRTALAVALAAFAVGLLLGLLF